MRFGLDDKKVEKLTRALRQSKRVKKAVIFGSRARGDYQISLFLYWFPRLGRLAKRSSQETLKEFRYG